jgi:hypothetical protein
MRGEAQNDFRKNKSIDIMIKTSIEKYTGDLR